MDSFFSNENVNSFLILYATCSLEALTTFMPWEKYLKSAVISFSRPFAGKHWWWGILCEAWSWAQIISGPGSLVQWNRGRLTTASVNLGKTFGFSGPQLLHLENG